MRIGVLGPVSVRVDEQWRAIGGAKCRAVLAALAAQAPGVVSIETLIDEVWGTAPPKTAPTQIHGYVLRLRRLLDDGVGQVVVTEPPGYRLCVRPDDLDAAAAAAGLAEATALMRGGDPEAAVEVLDRTLALWRGEPYADVTASDLVQSRVDRLRELRLTLLETQVDARIEAGRHGEVIGGLRDLIAEHPLREQLWHRLMLALHRSGRQAEALQEYARLRRMLVDELAVEPCGTVQALHQKILSGEDDAPAQDPARSVVCQLPADVADFTGRQDELRCVVDQLSDSDPTRPPAVVVVHGSPGIGKSTFALHSARQLASAYPDGQLYLDLAGTADAPRDPAALLAELLGSLGVSGRAIPDESAARSALLRSVLADRRVLLFLDDACSAEQVRPLLPPHGGSAVVVTSRRLLTGLAGARHVQLDPLDPASAYDLLARIVGSDRVATESEVAHDITRACGYLPLSIRIAGGKLLGRPGWTLAVLRSRLADESRRLEELRLGDLDVRSSVDLSLRLLTDEARRAFALLGLLGLLGSHDWPGWVVAPLLDRDHADDVLDALVDANLVSLTSTDRHGQPRYRLHDLLRVRAVDLCADLTHEQRRDAVARVVATWLHLVEDARHRLPPSPLDPPRGRALRRPVDDALAVARAADPFSWLDAERQSLVATVQLAADWDLVEPCWELAATLAAYFDDRALLEDWRHSHDTALAAAGDDPLACSVLLRGLAQIHLYRSEIGDAATLAERAVDLARTAGDRRGQAMALGALVSAHRLSGRLDDAAALLHEALALGAELGDRAFEAHLRCSAGMVRLAQGRLPEARRWFSQSLVMAREEGDSHREAVVLRELSQVQHRCGDAAAALNGLDQAVEMLADLQDERCLAFTLTRRADVHTHLGRLDEAYADLASAAITFRRNGTLADEATCRQAMAALDATRGVRAVRAPSA
ncbi:AfsR/SARP family transcriptional regulator [Luteipulveratus halotolerans]|uniref:AfsR/SARP family transcriptional regulator n=1 Tax=Luteipulveratus halotolerans TaxID=1631356 RepID=UPI00067FD0CA|nr:BTAD domain-containing putative transcriptional regulator [Luteipulveratus halotolerans]